MEFKNLLHVWERCVVVNVVGHLWRENENKKTELNSFLKYFFHKEPGQAIKIIYFLSFGFFALFFLLFVCFSTSFYALLNKCSTRGVKIWFFGSTSMHTSRDIIHFYHRHGPNFLILCHFLNFGM